MKNILLSLLMVSSFSYSQIIDFQGFMDFSYINDSGKIILNIEELDKEFLYRNPDSKYPFPKYKE